MERFSRPLRSLVIWRAGRSRAIRALQCWTRRAGRRVFSKRERAGFTSSALHSIRSGIKSSGWISMRPRLLVLGASFGMRDLTGPSSSKTFSRSHRTNWIAPCHTSMRLLGTPPFIRYQEHTGPARKQSLKAALAQGVRLSGLASSWAALLVHACAFLKPEGRLAMVLPAELLTVGYAEPIRLWLGRAGDSRPCT